MGIWCLGLWFWFFWTTAATQETKYKLLRDLLIQGAVLVQGMPEEGLMAMKMTKEDGELCRQDLRLVGSYGVSFFQHKVWVFFDQFLDFLLQKMKRKSHPSRQLRFPSVWTLSFFSKPQNQHKWRATTSPSCRFHCEGEWYLRGLCPEAEHHEGNWMGPLLQHPCKTRCCGQHHHEGFGLHAKGDWPSHGQLLPLSCARVLDFKVTALCVFVCMFLTSRSYNPICWFRCVFRIFFKTFLERISSSFTPWCTAPAATNRWGSRSSCSEQLFSGDQKRVVNKSRVLTWSNGWMMHDVEWYKHPLFFFCIFWFVVGIFFKSPGARVPRNVASPSRSRQAPCAECSVMNYMVDGFVIAKQLQRLGVFSSLTVGRLGDFWVGPFLAVPILEFCFKSEVFPGRCLPSLFAEEGGSGVLRFAQQLGIDWFFSIEAELIYAEATCQSLAGSTVRWMLSQRNSLWGPRSS